MTRNFTHDELQRAFDLAFILHPRVDVALRVVIDACDVLILLERAEARRARSKSHYKLPIPTEALLQFAVYTASYIRELDQEGPLPRMEPRYTPTRDDQVVRYLKHLIWRTVLIKNGCYLGVGLGCLVYNYQPHEIADLLAFFEEPSIRRIKMRLKREMIKRFLHSGVVLPEHKGIRSTLANDYDRMLLQETLKALTPWQTSHVSPASSDQSLLETLFESEIEITDWDRKHVFICPDCGGLECLINEYNKLFGKHGTTLEDPSVRLFVPDFEGPPTPPVNRFERRQLTESEIVLLNERHTPSGPWAYDLDALMPYLEDCDLGDPWKEYLDWVRGFDRDREDIYQGVVVGYAWEHVHRRLETYAKERSCSEGLNEGRWGIGKCRILFLSANPWTTGRILVDEEAREISEKIQESTYRDKFELHKDAATRPIDLQRWLMYQPHIVHFSGHGSKKQKIISTELRDAGIVNLCDPVDPKEILHFFDRPPVVKSKEDIYFSIAYEVPSLPELRNRSVCIQMFSETEDIATQEDYQSPYFEKFEDELTDLALFWTVTLSVPKPDEELWLIHWWIKQEPLMVVAPDGPLVFRITASDIEDTRKHDPRLVVLEEPSKTIEPCSLIEQQTIVRSRVNLDLSNPSDEIVCLIGQASVGIDGNPWVAH